MTLPVYKFRSKDLYAVMKDVGVAKDPEQFLMRKIREGKFTPPREAPTKPWKFTQEQLIEIAKAFQPGGAGEWHFVG